jgi:hypothetical protein
MIQVSARRQPDGLEAISYQLPPSAFLKKLPPSTFILGIRPAVSVASQGTRPVGFGRRMPTHV